MISDALLHYVLIVGGFATHQALRSTWKMLSNAVGIGFREGLAARVRAGRELTPEEKEQLDITVREKLAKKLQQDQD